MVYIRAFIVSTIKWIFTFLVYLITQSKQIALNQCFSPYFNSQYSFTIAGVPLCHRQAEYKL